MSSLLTFVPEIWRFSSCWINSVEHRQRMVGSTAYFLKLLGKMLEYTLTRYSILTSIGGFSYLLYTTTDNRTGKSASSPNSHAINFHTGRFRMSLAEKPKYRDVAWAAFKIEIDNKFNKTLTLVLYNIFLSFLFI